MSLKYFTGFTLFNILVIHEPSSR